jgi:hypothetical protein
MKASETVHCRGHPHIRGTHPTTFEVTKEEDLTLRGDCIIGVGADKGAADLDPGFSRLLQDDRARLYTTLRAGTCEIRVSSRGAADLTLTHPRDLVWRKSGFIDGRTVGILSDRAAVHLPRGLIRRLRDEVELTVEMTVVIPGLVP